MDQADVEKRIEGLGRQHQAAGLPPAAWYPDPGGAPFRRYWDGCEWTSATDEPIAAPTRPGTGKLSRRAKIALVRGAVITLAIIAVAVFVFVDRPRPVVLSFKGLNEAYGVAVDSAGDVYVADTGNNRVLKLPKGGTGQIVLPFTGLKHPCGVAVDGAGNLYVADWPAQQALKLRVGSGTPVVLPFTGLNKPGGVAVDTGGNVYLVDRVDPAASANGRLLKLPAGSTSQIQVSPLLRRSGRSAPVRQ